MDTTSILRYLLPLFILLANVENNFGYYVESDDDLEQLDCHIDRRYYVDILCRGRSKIEEQVTRLKTLFANTVIDQLTFANRGRNPYELTSNILEGLKIRELILSNSHINRFAEKKGGPAFVGLENSLEILRISKCSIKEVGENLFSLSHLLKLREFQLSRSGISSFGNGYFGDSSENSIQVINIYNNAITEIGDTAFASLQMLRSLDISRNRIKELKRSMFPNPASHLEDIHASENSIEILPKDLFKGMPALDFVDLRGTVVKTLDEATFQPIWSQLILLVIDSETCEEDDIGWIFKEKQPDHLFVDCGGEDLDEKLSKRREHK